MQGNELKTNEFIDWSKELWFALFFLTIGFTIWPLLVYFLGQAIGVNYFAEMSLRTWAEQKVYGPLGDGLLRAGSRVFFLCLPYGLSFVLRYCLFIARRAD